MLLSIITINKNNAAGLQKTIESVVSQTSDNFEYIIIDGASSDESTAVIKKYTENSLYSKKITYWISEPDTGIYNAMNKGIEKAHGSYCLFLNSGDYLLSSDIVKRLETTLNDDSDIYYANAVSCQNNIPMVHEYKKNPECSYFINVSINHQNTLIKRSLFENTKNYNEDFKFLSDWYFIMYSRYKLSAQFKHIDFPIAFYDNTGVSSTTPPEILKGEYNKAIQYVFGNFTPLIQYYNQLESEYKNSIWYNITHQWGTGRFLIFILKVYRFFVRCLVRKKSEVNKRGIK